MVPRIESLFGVLQAAARILPEDGPPCFGHLRIETGGNVRDVLLGGSNRAAEGALLIHWQTAPLAEIFFTCGEGEEYEIEIDGRVAIGRLLEKNLLGFEGAELAWVATSDAVFCRADDFRAATLPLSKIPREKSYA